MKTHLETERLTLREMDRKDFCHLAEMMQDPAVMYAWTYTFSRDEVAAWIDRMTAHYAAGRGYLLMVEKATGAVVGQAGLLPEEIHGAAQLGVGYILKRRFFGRGFAAEAARGCVEHAFRRLAVPMVVAEIRPENAPSLRVAAKLGMRCRDRIEKEVAGRALPHDVYALDSPLVRVLPHDSRWAAEFEAVRRAAAGALAGFRCRIEHVGSTAVPGLAAKPVIDLDIIPESWASWPVMAEQLAGLGFRRRGDLGIVDREAFYASPRFPFRQNLYLCRAGSLALANHLRLRDYLRSHPDQARRYGELKLELAARHPEDVAAYCEGKTELLGTLLRAAGLPPDDVAAIERANRA